MATINYIPERIQTKSVMKRVIDYCSQEKKTVDPETGIRYLSGINCDPNDNAYDLFLLVHLHNLLYMVKYNDTN